MRHIHMDGNLCRYLSQLYKSNLTAFVCDESHFTAVQCSTHTLFSTLKTIIKINVMDALFLTDTFISPSLFRVLFIISSILCREQFKHILVFF